MTFCHVTHVILSKSVKRFIRTCLQGVVVASLMKAGRILGDWLSVSF